MLAYVSDPILPTPTEKPTDIQIDHDFVLSVAKKAMDARKKVLEGFGKGLARISANYSAN